MDIVKTDSKDGKKVGYFNKYILNRIKNNKNFISAITGQTGSGKSYSALREGEVLDPDFDIRNVCFTPKQFMDLVNEKEKKLKKGSVLVFDEVQVSLSHIEWQSLQARMLNYVLQTFRHRNFIMFMTSPHFKFINASARRLFHSRIETVSINYNDKIVNLKPFLLQTNQETGDTYHKYLRVYVKGSGLVPLKNMRVGMPSDKLLKAYEEKKTKFTSDLNAGILNDLEEKEAKKQQKGNYKELTTKQEEILQMLEQKLTIKDVSKRLGISLNTIYKQLDWIKKKGVVITSVRSAGSSVSHYDIHRN